MDIVYAIMALGCVGGTYAAVVVPAYLVALRVTGRGRHPSDAFLLAVPIGVYLLLTHAIDDRQGFNWYVANLVIAAPVTAALFVV